MQRGNCGVASPLSTKPRLVYDGVCNLCTAAVRFLYTLDKGRIVHYVAYQQLGSRIRRQYGLTADLLQGRMHLISEDGSLASGPIAMTEVCKLLTPFSFICNLFRTRLAQRLYDWVARRRYRVFGCRNTCYVIKPQSSLP